MDFVEDYNKEFRTRLVNETATKIWNRTVYNQQDELMVLVRWVEDSNREKTKKQFVGIFEGLKAFLFD